MNKPVSNSELAERIEKHLIIEALEDDANIFSYRKMAALLDRSLIAWRNRNGKRSFIRRMLDIRSNSRYRAPSNMDNVNVSDFDEYEYQPSLKRCI